MNKSIYSDLMIERYVLGELPKVESKKIDSRRKIDDELNSRIELIYEQNDTFFKSHPAPLFVENIKKAVKNGTEIKKVKSKKLTFERFKTRFLEELTIRNLVSVAAAAAVVVLVIAFPPFYESTMFQNLPAGDEGTRLKGGPTLMIYRKEEGGTSMLVDKATAAAGDKLQLFYRSGGFNYGAIFSLDGNGVLTRHFPLGGNSAATLKEGQKVALERSYQLDDAPSYERFFFIVSTENFALGEIEDEVRNAGESGSLKLDENISYTTLVLEKE
jgi:hypothetical protein